MCLVAASSIYHGSGGNLPLKFLCRWQRADRMHNFIFWSRIVTCNPNSQLRSGQAFWHPVVELVIFELLLLRRFERCPKSLAQARNMLLRTNSHDDCGLRF